MAYFFFLVQDASAGRK